MSDLPWLSNMVDDLARVEGVVGVMLGGSRARDEHPADSDVDLGIYYDPPLHTDALRTLARQYAGPDAEVTEPGGWGPWVDGGGWLRVGGVAVDWIYRDLGRVRTSWADARRGSFTFHAQTGHPFGVPDFQYAGEVALGVLLSDSSGELTRLHRAAQEYPKALSDALVAGLSEADFLIRALHKSARRADTVWVAGCLFRVVMVCTHAVFGRSGRWLINEKGAVSAAGQLLSSPPEFTILARGVLAQLGVERADLTAAVDAAADLVARTRAAAGSTSDP